MKDYFQSPVNKSWVNFAGHPKGDAMDLGWRKGHSVNQDVFMIADGEVIWVGYLSDGGNSIVTKHDYNSRFDAWVGLMHFKDPTPHKVGDKLKRGVKVGNMGKTGESKGEHVHIRISLVPKGAPFKWDTFDRFRVNPYDYVFEFPHQDVLDLKKKPSKPFIKPSNNKEVEEDGEITVTVDVGLRVRQAPSLKAEQTGLLSKGTKKLYTHYVDAEGIRWVKLKEGGYAARRTLDNKKIYASARFLNDKPQSKPKPQPKPNKVGKYANFGGNVRLFQKAVGDECYHSSKNGQKNVYTNIRNTSAKVLDEKNGRVLVSVPRFKPNRVWIANAESSISNSAKYKL